MKTVSTYLQEHPNDELYPSEIAQILKDLDDASLAQAIKEIPQELVGDVALELPDRYFDDIVDSFSPKELAVAVTELESDDQTDFMQELEELDEQVAQKVFNHLDSDDQENILQLKQYEPDEAGAYMQTETYVAGLDKNVHEVIRDFAQLRKSGELENIHYLFVTDSSNKLRYGIGLDTLLVFDFEKSVRENIAEAPDKYIPISATAHEPISEVVKKFQEYNLTTLPIVAEDGTLLGRITSDDIYDIMDEQATDQMYHLAGVSDDAEEDDDIVKAGKSRAVWLIINLGTAVAASLVIGLFEETLQSVIALAILMPIVASMGGNAGTQSLTVVVRQLALGEIAQHDAFRIIRKEVIISLLNGLLFALILGVIASMWFNQPLLGVVIGLSMVINLLSAGIFGSVVPLLLKKMNIDPAIGSTVILTTVTDVVGFFSFLGLATLILV